MTFVFCPGCIIIPHIWKQVFYQNKHDFLQIREHVFTLTIYNSIYEMRISDLLCTNGLIFLSKVACYANSEDC